MTFPETPRLTLRQPVTSDIPLAAEFYASPRSRFVGGPSSYGTYWRFAATVMGHWAIHGFGLFTVVRRDSGKPIGWIGPWFPGDWPDHEIGWQIWNDADLRQGFASEAAAATRDWARATLNWTRIVSYIAPDNTASIAVAEHIGATRDDSLPHPPGKPCLVYRHVEASA